MDYEESACRNLQCPWGGPGPKMRTYTPQTCNAMKVEEWIPVPQASILVVDSYRDEAEMYAQYLASVGANVESVPTPEEAFIRLIVQPPAVIVTDMVFCCSAYDGPSFLHAVRSRSGFATTNCIVLSGFTRTVDRERARAAGADRFLVKPCSPYELRRHVETAVRANMCRVRAAWNWPEDDTVAPSDPHAPRHMF